MNHFELNMFCQKKEQDAIMKWGTEDGGRGCRQGVCDVPEKGMEARGRVERCSWKLPTKARLVLELVQRSGR